MVGRGVSDGGNVWVFVGINVGASVFVAVELGIGVKLTVGVIVIVAVHVGGRDLENVEVGETVIGGVQPATSKIVNTMIKNMFSLEDILGTIEFLLLVSPGFYFFGFGVRVGVAVRGRKSSVGTGGNVSLNPSLSVKVK